MAEASNRTVVPCKRYAKLLENDDNDREKNWASNLVVLRDDYTLQESVDVLKNKIEETLAEITDKTGYAITEFTIGKTIAVPISVNGKSALISKCKQNAVEAIAKVVITKVFQLMIKKTRLNSFIYTQFFGCFNTLINFSSSLPTSG